MKPASGRQFSKELCDEGGQALVFVALCLPMLFGALGLAVDAGLLFKAKASMQTAADCAAISGAAEVDYGDLVAAAQAAATQNGETNGTNGATVAVNNPPRSGVYMGQQGYVEVVVSQIQPTFFMGVLTGSNSMTVSARAVAALAPSSYCIYALSPTGTDILINNDAQVKAVGCGVLDDSSSSSAISVSGSGNLTASAVGAVGNVSVDNSGSKITPSASTGMIPVSDPLAFLQPPSYTPASCGSDPLTHYGNGGSSYSVGPGSAYSTTQSGNLVCYTSLTLGANNDQVTLNPGTYVITGALTFNSGTNFGGQGVTFYLTGSGSVNIANGATLALSAPTSGTYDGILFYQARSDTQTASIQGGANSTLNGILYFPSAALNIGNGSSSTFNISLVASTLTFNGGSGLTVNPYSAVNASSPIASPRIVE